MLKQITDSGYMLVKSKLNKAHANGALYGRLMRDFPEGVVGMKNMGTIRSMIKGHIEAGNPEKAVQYAKEQRAKISSQSKQYPH